MKFSEQINNQTLMEFIEKAISFGGLISKDAKSLLTSKYDYMTIADKIEWLLKACENAVFAGQYNVIELEKEIKDKHIFK